MILLHVCWCTYAAQTITSCEDVNNEHVFGRKVFSDTEVFCQEMRYGTDPDQCDAVRVVCSREITLEKKAETVKIERGRKAITIKVVHENNSWQEDTISVKFSQIDGSSQQTSRIHTSTPAKGHPGVVRFGQWNEKHRTWRPGVVFGERPHLQGYYAVTEKITRIMNFPFVCQNQKKMCFLQIVVNNSGLDMVFLRWGTTNFDGQELTQLHGESNSCFYAAR